MRWYKHVIIFGWAFFWRGIFYTCHMNVSPNDIPLSHRFWHLNIIWLLLTYELHLTAFPKPNQWIHRTFLPPIYSDLDELYEYWKSLAQQEHHKKRKKSSSFPPQLPSSLAMELLLHQLIPGPSSWFKLIAKNAGQFELPRLFHGSGWTTDPPKKIQYYRNVWQTNPQTPPFNFGKIRLRLIQQKPNRIGSQSRNLLRCFGENFSVCGCGFAQEVLETETRGWYWDNVDARLGIGPFEIKFIKLSKKKLFRQLCVV